MNAIVSFVFPILIYVASGMYFVSQSRAIYESNAQRIHSLELSIENLSRKLDDHAFKLSKRIDDHIDLTK